MASKKQSEVNLSDFFVSKKWISSDGREVRSLCCVLCGDPSKTFKCESKWNLKRHLVTKHKEKAKEIGLDKDLEDENCDPNAQSFKNKIKVSFWVDPNDHKKRMVKWVSVGNVPLNFFNLKCVQEVLHPIEEGMKIGHTNRHNILQYVHDCTVNAVKHISLEMQGKLISIKADLASRKGRTILGINAQFIKHGEIVVRTLMMAERFEKNTAENIMEEILRALATFDIQLPQIYSITTDNGSNMLKATRLTRNLQELNDSCLDEREESEYEDTDAEGDEELSADTDEPNSIDFETTEEPSESDALWDDDFHLQDMKDDELPVIEKASLTGIRCAAHTVQLSVLDVLKKDTVAKFLTKTRKLVKTLRAQPYGNMFRHDKTKKLPFFDGDTRWGSSHQMVDCLLQQQDFIISMLPPNLLKDYSANYWKRVEQFVLVTTPLYVLTKRIQEETMTCGQLFLYWKECCLDLEVLQDTLAKQLLDALVERKPMWFNNPAFYAALLVDLRLNEFDPPILTAEQKEEGIMHMLATWKSIKAVTGKQKIEVESTAPTSSKNTPLKRVQQLLSASKQSKPPDISEMEKKIRRLSLEPSLPLECDVIEWWDKQYNKDVDLVQLALTVLQLPCTQVSVERSFNGLGQILSKFRTSLGSIPLQQILFLKANDNFIDSIYMNFA